MRAYLKNGKNIRISQKVANAIWQAKQEGKDTVVEANTISKNLSLYVDVDEVIFIK